MAEAAATWPQAPELDEKYDVEIIQKYPTVTAITESADEKKGYAGHLDEAQKAQLFQLRSMLEAEGYTKELDTLTLLRFLRARKFNVNDAKKMFIDFAAWRKEIKLDDLVPTWEYDEREALAQYYSQYYHKTDKDGRPVYIEHLGKVDLNPMYKITTKERMLDNLAVEYEKCSGSRLPACSRKAGTLVETFCTIMDMDGVSLFGLGEVYGYVQQASVISQNYYPERLGKLYIINAPWGFASVWRIVKGWLDPVTVKKIHILGGGYKKDLLAQIPAENLPKALGGTCVCNGDEASCRWSDAGPWQDEAAIAKQKKEAGQPIDDKDLPWFERPAVIEQATKNLAGTDKDPILRKQGGQTVGADGQQVASVAS